MKMRYLLPVFVVAGLASQAQAACNIKEGGSTACCLYENDPSNCYGIGGPNDKDDDGNLTTEATCTASSGKVQQNCDASTDDIYYCAWGSGSCWPEEDQEACIAGSGSVYKNVPSSGRGEGKKCEGGEWVAGKDPGAPSRGYCNWGDCEENPSNPYGCLSGGCAEIQTDEEEDDCHDIVANQEACPVNSLPPAYRPSATQRFQSMAALVVVPDGRALLISSQKETTVSLFDLSGKQVFSQKLAAGYNTLNLNGQKMGVYYAVVSSGSSKQTVKVVLK